MRRLVPGLAVPVLVGLPIWVETTWGIGLLSAVSGVLCVAAILRASLSVGTAGGAVALISLSVAYRQIASSSDLVGPAVFGLALLLLIDGIHWCKRFDGAAVAGTLWRRQIAWWTARGAVCLAIAIVFTMVASVVAGALPVLWAPFLAGLGVLAAFVGAMAFARLGTDE